MKKWKGVIACDVLPVAMFLQYYLPHNQLLFHWYFFFVHINKPLPYCCDFFRSGCVKKTSYLIQISFASKTFCVCDVSIFGWCAENLCGLCLCAIGILVIPHSHRYYAVMKKHHFQKRLYYSYKTIQQLKMLFRMSHIFSWSLWTEQGPNKDFVSKFGDQ